MTSSPRPLGLAAKALLAPARLCLNRMLAKAVEHGSIPWARRFLLLGADPDARARAGFTPLTLNHAHPEALCSLMAELLLDFGADPNLPNLDGLRPLHYAAHFGEEHLFATLLHAGADPDAPDARGLSPSRMLRALLQKASDAQAKLRVEALLALCERTSLRREAYARDRRPRGASPPRL